MKIDLETKELLEYELDYDDIVLWCYQNEIIDENKVRELLKLDSSEKLPEISKRTSIDLGTHGWYHDDLLEEMQDEDIIEYLENNGHVIDPAEPDMYDFVPETKSSWINFMKSFYHSNFGKVWTKEDFKKEICKLIDDEII